MDSPVTSMQKTEKCESIIFLDIEGVLFSRSPSSKQQEKIDEKSQELFSKKFRELKASQQCKVRYSCLNSKAVKNFRGLIGKIETEYGKVGIVITDDCRHNLSVRKIKRLVSQHSFSSLIVDKTVDGRLLYMRKGKFMIGSTDKIERKRANLSKEQESQIKANEIMYWIANHRRKFAVSRFLVLEGGGRVLEPNSILLEKELFSKKHAKEAYNIIKKCAPKANLKETGLF
jgi:HAD domain in Swiss Army Knife RNA repair proteins